MATVDLNLPHLASYCSLPESSLRDLLSNPTVQIIRSLLEKVSLRSHEQESLKAENLKLAVELENAVRAGEAKSRVLKGSVDRVSKEAVELRNKLQVEETANNALEVELLSIKSSTSSTSHEVSSLRNRIESLESSNRDTLSLLESKSRAYDDLASELSAKHQKVIQLRQEISSHEETIRSLNAASSSTKYREQNFHQEIDSLKRNNDWLDQELKTKAAELSKFRKEKLARIAELQRQNEDAATYLEAANRTEQTLRSRLEEVNQKADEFLSLAQQLREEATRQEENFRSELDTANRLAELMRNSVNTERLRQQDLQAQLEQAKDNASEQLGKINAEMETEHQDRIAAERKVAELEVHIERLEADALTHDDPPTGLVSPRPRINGSIRGTPDHESSPPRMSSPNLSRSRGGLNFTQMFSEYHSAKAELEAERRRNEKLSETIDEMVQDMETRQPEIEELRLDHDRLEADVVEMSSMVDNIGKERDQAKKEARKWESRVDGMVREGELLRQQLRDLSSQVKVLLIEVSARGEGREGFAAEERLRIEQFAQGDMDAESSHDATDTDRFISQNLVNFRNIAALQEQNTKLLRLTRELGNQMEGEEAQRSKSEASQTLEELESMRQKYDRCKDEIQSLVTQSQSYIRERDMFRRILSHRGQLPPESDLASMFGESINGGAAPATPSRNNLLDSVERSPTSREMADHVKALKEMQSHFDAYRQEAASDRATLKEQLDNVSKNNGELRSEVSRRNGEVLLAHERYEMLQANYAMLKSENSELQKRSQILSERAAQQDVRVQQVAEDLVEAKGLLESMRNETANLKAEKDFWKSIEKRLTEDNQSLVSDRDRLNALNATLQNLQNEREHSDKASRRRLESQIESLEGELQGTKRKLSDEVEEHKRAALRREFEQQQSQKRIDDLISTLGSAREELAAGRAGRDHLQARVDEMTIELRSTEERLHVHQSTSSPSANTMQQHQSNGVIASDTQPAVSREQELATEVSEIRQRLEDARSELDNAKTQIEQYKAISQSSEEELQSLNDTQDQYRQEMDKIIEEKDTKIRELNQDLEGIRSELLVVNSNLSSVRTEKVESDRKLQEQKTSFDTEVARITDLNDRNETAARYHQEDLKAQAEIARQAQQNYENELVKHADAAKNLQKLRADHSQLKLEIAELRSEAESACMSLAQNEESWAETRERYEREITDLKSRRDDVINQNQLLHKQLENVNTQISDLQQKRASKDVEDETTGRSSSSGLDNLQELIKYLRREKEIVDVQLELSSQEAKRLKQHLDYTQSQLDEARLKLNQQRRAEENNERNTLNHNKLMETINELNLNRESNVALRLEKNQAQDSLNEKSKLVEELSEQIQSLHVKVQELEDTKEAQEEELRMTREARERFEQRYHDILNRSDSVDPVEFESLKEQNAALQTEREDLVAVSKALQEQVDTIPDQIRQAQDQANERWQENRLKLVEQFKTRSRELSAKIQEKDAALKTAVDAVSQEKEELQTQLVTLQESLQATKAERDQAIAAQEAAQVEISKSQIPTGSEDGQVNEEEHARPDAAEMANLHEQLHAAQTKVDEEVARSVRLQSELVLSQTRVSELENQLVTMQQDLNNANAQILEILAQQSQQQTVSQPKTSADVGLDGQLENLRQELAQASQDLEALRSAAAINASVANVQTQDDTTHISEQIAEQVEAIREELTARHDERIRQSEDQYKKRTDTMKKQLTTKLKDGKEEIRQSMTAGHEQALNLLKAQHDEEVHALKSRHQEELDELKRNENTRFEDFKQAYVIEHPPTTMNGDTVVKHELQSQASNRSWELSEIEVKDLIARNETAKAIVSRNIRTGIQKERDAIITQVKEEQHKILVESLAESDTKAKSSREQAVLMEGKRYGVKINMADNRARLVQAKIDYIANAAVETPQKPVAEVWEIAKAIKPAPATSQQPSSQSNPFSQVPPIRPNQAQAATGTFGQPTPAGGQMHPPSAPKGPNESPLSTVMNSPAQTQSSSSAASPAGSPPQGTTANGDQQTTRLPDKPLSGQGNQRTNVGTGPAAIKSLQSSLPLPSGGRSGSGQFIASQFQNTGGPQNHQASRGSSNIGRGRGRGTGRAGLNVSTHAPQSIQQAQGSPNGPPLSATARQFVPQGNKRVRDADQDPGSDGNSGKRIRGGD